MAVTLQNRIEIYGMNYAFLFISNLLVNIGNGFENFGLVMTFKCIMLEIVTSFNSKYITFYTDSYSELHTMLVEICSKFYQ